MGRCFEHYFNVWKRSFVYDSRARRSELLCFVLLNALVIFVLSLAAAAEAESSDTSGAIELITAVYGLLVFLPFLAVTVRRLHNFNYSGLWVLLYFVPLVNILFALAVYFASGTPGPNRFGPDPRTPDLLNAP